MNSEKNTFGTEPWWKEILDSLRLPGAGPILIVPMGRCLSNPGLCQPGTLPPS